MKEACTDVVAVEAGKSGLIPNVVWRSAVVLTDRFACEGKWRRLRQG